MRSRERREGVRDLDMNLQMVPEEEIFVREECWFKT
jgi:hypothetical protein